MHQLSLHTDCASKHAKANAGAKALNQKSTLEVGKYKNKKSEKERKGYAEKKRKKREPELKKSDAKILDRWRSEQMQSDKLR